MCVLLRWNGLTTKGPPKASFPSFSPKALLFQYYSSPSTPKALSSILLLLHSIHPFSFFLPIGNAKVLCTEQCGEGILFFLPDLLSFPSGFYSPSSSPQSAPPATFIHWRVRPASIVVVFIHSGCRSLWWCWLNECVRSGICWLLRWLVGWLVNNANFPHTSPTKSPVPYREKQSHHHKTKPPNRLNHHSSQSQSI